MVMKKKLRYCLYVLIGFTLVMSYVFMSDWGDFTIKVTTMLSGLCGLGTLYIAILLYDRYGIEAKTGEKVHSDVEAVITELQKVNFVLCSYPEYEDGDTPQDFIIPMSFQSVKEYVVEHITPQALSSILYYKDSGMYGCVQLVQKARSCVYLPKSIMESVEKLSITRYESSDLKKEDRPITTLSSFSDKISNGNDSLDGDNTRIPEANYSVIQFIDAYFCVKEAIVKWYKDNGIDTTNLNL